MPILMFNHINIELDEGLDMVDKAGIGSKNE